MKTTMMLVAGVALTSMLSASAFAAPRHHAMNRDPANAYARAIGPGEYRLPSDVVTFAGRVVGADPDQNIRAQLERDPTPSEY